MAVADFNLVLGDTSVMSASILAQILEVPLVEVLPFPLIPPLFEQQQSIPNPVAYLPQLGTFYTLDMVRQYLRFFGFLHNMTVVRHLKTDYSTSYEQGSCMAAKLRYLPAFFGFDLCRPYLSLMAKTRVFSTISTTFALQLIAIGFDEHCPMHPCCSNV